MFRLSKCHSCYVVVRLTRFYISYSLNAVKVEDGFRERYQEAKKESKDFALGIEEGFKKKDK